MDAEPPSSDPSEAIWNVLISAGVPVAGARVPPAPVVAAIVAALRQAVAWTDTEAWQREAIAAFILAWAHEWPAAFQGAFGADADALGAWARQNTPDRDRYLKLRRIAIANLAGVL